MYGRQYGVCVNEKHIAETAKDDRSPYSSSDAGSGVVLRHRAFALQLLPVDAAVV